MQLSQIFFQQFLDGQVSADMQPLLQVLEVRQQTSTSLTGYQSPGEQQHQMRARLNDGVYSYSGCIVPITLCKRFEDDGLCSHNGIIKVMNWKSVNMGGKNLFQILDYMLCSLDFPVIGNPIPHSGIPEKHRDESTQLMNKTVQTGGGNAVANWRSTQHLVKEEEPENVMISSSATKRRGESPMDQREPLRKKQSDGGGTVNPANSFITPVDVITPYINRYRICGIVSDKDEAIKELSNARGKFRVFGFVVTDSNGKSIRMSAFGEEADKFFGIINNDKVYYISGLGGSRSVKLANKRFNTTNNPYEITLDRSSEVTYCTDHFKKPPLKLNLISLKDILKHVDQHVDVQAIVDRVDEISPVITRKDQRQLIKRDVYLVDISAVEVLFTLWGEQAKSFAVEPGTVLGIKGAVVREFNSGFSLSTSFNNTHLLQNPEGQLTEKLYLWYKEYKPSANIKSLSIGASTSESFAPDFAFIGLIKQDGVDPKNDKGEYYNVKAIIMEVKEEQVGYQACPQVGCKKKVSVVGTNQYRCEKCNAVFDTYRNALMLQLEIADFTGSVWVTLFNERAEQFLGATAEQLMQWQKDDHYRFKKVFDDIKSREFLFRVRVKNEVYNDAQQLRWSVVDVRKVPVEKFKAMYEKTLAKFEGI